MPLVYREQLPPDSLARRVECIWSLETEAAVDAYRVSPDACLDIVYRRGEGLHAIGAMTVEQRFDFEPETRLIGIRFRPGMARSFLGVSAAELTGSSCLLEELWSRRGRDLVNRLDDAESLACAAHLMMGSLLPPVGAVNPVQRAIEAMTEANGNVDVRNLARQAGLSPRQFRRRCLEESGLAPKLLARILRFRHACRLAYAKERPNWAAIASESHYFDQAHLIRDFREFSGTTPMAVFSNTAIRVPG